LRAAKEKCSHKEENVISGSVEKLIFQALLDQAVSRLLTAQIDVTATLSEDECHVFSTRLSNDFTGVS
jgi:hypothetical protein